MSQIETPDLVLEWSPEEVRAYWPGSGNTRTGSTISDVVNGNSSGKALVLISRRASFIRTTRLPNVGGRDLQMLVRNALPGLVPLPSGELAYDVIQTGDMNQEGRLVILGAILNPYLVRIKAEAKAAGVNVVGVVPAGFTGVTIAHKVGLPDAAVVEEVAGGMNIDLIANNLIRYSRLAMPAGDLESEVARTYAAAGLPPASVITTGRAHMEAGYSSTLTSLKAAAEMDIRHLPMNLELTSEIEKRVNDEINSRRRLAGGILLAAVVLAAYVIDQRTTQWAAISAKLNAGNQAVQKLQNQSDLTTKKIQQIAPVQLAVDRGFSPPQQLVDVIKTITNDTPQSVWITGLSLERGKPFTIRGSSTTAEAVTKFLTKLGTESRLRDVKLLYANDAMILNQQIVQFSIQGFPVGNLPIVDDVKKTGTGAATSAPKTTGGGA